MSIGEEIRRLRISKNMTQHDLAILTGLERSYISKLELNKRKGSIDSLELIADALGMKLKLEIVPK